MKLQSAWRRIQDLGEKIRHEMGVAYQRAPFRARVAGYLVAMLVVTGFLAVHVLLVLDLGERGRKTAEREAELYRYALKERLQNRQGSEFIAEVMQGSDIPLLFTSMDGTPKAWRNIPWIEDRKVSEESDWEGLQTSQKRKVEEFRETCIKSNSVLPVVIGATPMGQLYHGGYTPYRQLHLVLVGGAAAIALLALLTWYGIKIMQGTERSLLWVGLARETAHQLGTPISSLVGWIEYMRFRSKETPSLGRLADEMERDLGRLKQVVARFSQIGSLPELHLQDPNTVIRTVVDYFAPRLPKEDRKVVIDLDLALVADIPLNRELLGWVLENLIKNALDAMDRTDGRILITSRPSGTLNQDIRIDVEDNGRGIPPQHMRDVFLPGWSTKKRGWGLGLALARRIVEQYHRGKIWVDHSRLGEGTAFSILLRDPSASVRNRSGV